MAKVCDDRAKGQKLKFVVHAEIQGVAKKEDVNTTLAMRRLMLEIEAFVNGRMEATPYRGKTLHLYS